MRCIDFSWTKYDSTDGLGCNARVVEYFSLGLHGLPVSPTAFKPATLNFTLQSVKQKAKIKRDGTLFIKPPMTGP